MKKIQHRNVLLRTWDRLPVIARAVHRGALCQFSWYIRMGRFPHGSRIGMDYSAHDRLLMVILQVFLKRSWGPKRFAAVMKENFRLTKLQASVWKRGLLCAVFFVIIVQASFVITFRLLDFPAAAFTADYKLLDTFPLWEAFAIIIMSSIVAAICEETGFRGYMQRPLEKRYGPFAAIVLTSIFFTAIHLGLLHLGAADRSAYLLPVILLGIIAYRTGSLIPGIVGHAILDVFDYSVWWTDLTGGFTKPTIFKTGVDLHFVSWVLIFAFALIAFFRIAGS